MIKKSQTKLIIIFIFIFAISIITVTFVLWNDLFSKAPSQAQGEQGIQGSKGDNGGIFTISIT